MAAGHLCVCVLLALAAGNLILAEEQDRMMFPFDMFSSFFGDGSRSKRSPSPEEQAVSANSSEHQDRFFFSSFYVASCNYSNTNETGLTCRDCYTASRCLPNNRAIVRRCRGFLLPYCNSGRCSMYPGSACNFTSG